MAPFPASLSGQDFRSWRSSPSRWMPTVADIARRHALPFDAPVAFPTGTNLVVTLGAELVLKVFPPLYGRQFVSERASLAQLRGRLDVAIPEVVAEGERDGWSYLAMTRVAGIAGSVAWPLVPEAQKPAILRQLGEAIAQVQATPPGPLLEIEPKWPQFLAAQIAGCRARHERLGMPRKYLGGLDEILAEAPRIIPTEAQPVILTGEYIPENFLLEESLGGWRLAALIDFGDVMTGWGEYDLLGPSAFMTSGKADRVRALFEGYGYSRADLDDALQRRLMALLLLHRASDPIRHIDIPGWMERATTLRDVQRLLWPFGETRA